MVPVTATPPREPGVAGAARAAAPTAVEEVFDVQVLPGLRVPDVLRFQ
jgi:hypothetical protein